MNVRCPNCDASYYIEHFATTTAMYYPPVYKDGVNVNPDGNITTITCTCNACGHDFAYQIQYGKIIDIKDCGKTKEVPVVEMPPVTSLDDNTMVDDAIYIKPQNTTVNDVEIPLTVDLSGVEREIDKLRQELQELKELVKSVFHTM